MQRQKRRRKKRKLSEIEDMIKYTKRNKKYNTLSKKLVNLNNMIGMTEVKEAVVEQLKFLICNDGDTESHFLNTVITGNPGCGKTTLARLLYEIWSTLEVFKNDKSEFKIVTRSDLVGSYMGHTATKTRKLLNKHSGHVIFIDEAYSLCGSNKDDYGKECIDELTSFLSEESGKTILIVAGYENELKNHFFNVNSGLARRFNWTFNIKKYSVDELYKIFLYQLNKNKWKLKENCIDLFQSNFDKMTNGGGDTSNIAFKCKLEYSKRTWKNARERNKVITREDVQKAMDKHLKKENVEVNHMYI